MTPPVSTSEAVSPAPVMRLPALSRPARLAVVGVLLAAIFFGGAALRFDQAGRPAPPRSADERAYLTLAQSLERHGAYGGPGSAMEDPQHWPPGAPALFALAERIDPGPPGSFNPPSVYTAQAIVGSLAILAAFAAAALFAGAWAGLAAAAATAFYPPLIDVSGRALSEPLGGLALALTLVACAWAARRPVWWRFGLAGFALGATLLVRADLLPALPLLALWAALVVGRRWKRAALAAAALVAGALVAVAPWVEEASRARGSLVPVTTSGGSAFFVGTYLPGNGNMYGLKRSLGNQLRLQDPRLANVPNFRLPQERLLELVAARHPELAREPALQREARETLDRYALHHPAAFARMLASKSARMWTTPNRGRKPLEAWRWSVHIALVGLALPGTLLGAWFARGRGLGAMVAVAAASTAVNAAFLSEPRHLLPLLPALFAAGAAGWLLLWSRLRGAQLEAHAQRGPAAGPALDLQAVDELRDQRQAQPEPG